MADKLSDEVTIVDQIRSCGFEPEQLGQGSYGKVFSVRDIGGSVYALKYIREPNYNIIGFQGLLELDILRRLDHPHLIHSPQIITPIICDLHEALAVVMPLADTTLNNTINKNLTTETRLNILYKLSTALAFMHQNNILHLDIKAPNIVLRNDEPYLIDFGLAMIVEDAHVGRYWNHELVTASNRPPEIFAGGRQYNGVVDVWSLGIVALWLLSGQPTIFSERPNWNDDKAMLDEINIIVNVRLPTLLTGIRDRYHEGCLSLVQGMLDLDPNKRLTSQQVVDHPVFDDFRTMIVGKIITRQYVPDYAADHRDILKVMLVWAQNIFGGNSAKSLFLAIDIYNRLGSFYKNEQPIKRMNMAAMSLIIAMKLFDEPYDGFPKYQRLLNKLVPEISVRDLLRAETEIIYYLDGVLYHSPFFDKLRTGDDLKLTFDNIIMDRDSTLYLRVDTEAWPRVARQLVSNVRYPSKNISIKELFS